MQISPSSLYPAKSSLGQMSTSFVNLAWESTIEQSVRNRERGRGACVKSEKSQPAISAGARTLESCVADSLVTQPSHIRGMTENIHILASRAA